MLPFSLTFPWDRGWLIRIIYIQLPHNLTPYYFPFPLSPCFTLSARGGSRNPLLSETLFFPHALFLFAFPLGSRMTHPHHFYSTPLSCFFIRPRWQPQPAVKRLYFLMLPFTLPFPWDRRWLIRIISI
jgi:hypothetical protein